MTWYTLSVWTTNFVIVKSSEEGAATNLYYVKNK